MFGFYPQVATFRPSMIPGLLCWFDAQDPLANGTTPTNGSSIGSWVDKSGNGHTAIQGSAPSQPVYSIGAFVNSVTRNGLTFGGSQLMTISNTGGLPTGSAPRTMVSVFLSTAVSGEQDYFSFGVSGSGGAFNQMVYNSAIAVDIYAFYVQAGSITNGSTYETCINYPGGTLSNATYTLNSVPQSPSGPGLSATPSTSYGAGYIGINVNGGNAMAGNLGDLLLYSGALSPSNQKWIETYLLAKYGI